MEQVQNSIQSRNKNNVLELQNYELDTFET